MGRSCRATAVAICFFAPWLTGCRDVAPGGAGTPELRAALFDTIFARTERRESFSGLKNELLGFDPLDEMRALRDSVVAAATENDLYHALARLSNARRDRHLEVLLVPDGIRPADVAGLAVWGAEASAPRQAPVRVLPDYATSELVYFVGDVAPDRRWPGLPEVGARVVEVNGMPVASWHLAAAPYMRHSTEAGLRWKLAEAMTQATAVFPLELRAEPLRLTVESRDGTQRSLTVPFVDPVELTWTGSSEPRYPDLSVERSTPTYDLLMPDEPVDVPFLVLVWRGFRETMVADVDTLVELAEREGLLGHALIVDVTRSRGGSLGAYALQRLQPRPFRTTFGNLRLSDVIRPFVEEKRAEFAARDVNDGGVPETVDDGTWLMDWLEQEVLPALEAGEEYSGDVPFKLAHAPRDSDGVLDPTPVHFRGPFAVISGPSGGSHLDQLVAIVVDNELGPVVGMPAGGYSNTWEWEEVLRFPGTDQPVIGFMWSIGSTVRPNGEVLEGNPADVDEWVPLTSENVERYYPLLLERTLASVGAAGR